MLLSTEPPSLDLRNDLARLRSRTNSKVQKKKKPRAVKVDKSNDKCHHCNEPGHWRRNCPAYLKTKVKGIVLVTKACLVADNVSSWIIDSAATNHICCSLTGFRKRKKLRGWRLLLQVG